MKSPMNLLLVVAVLEALADSFQTKPISVQPGKSVTLTGPDCSANASVTLERHGSDKYVVDIYSCIDGHAMPPERLDPSFVGRVEGTECPLKDGNVSVTLKNVTGDDAGEYEWFCKNNTGNSSLKVDLEVTDGGTADGGTTSGNTTSGNTTSGNTTSGNITSGNITSGNITSGNATSGNATSGIPPDVGAIAGGITGGTFAVVLIVIILYFCRNRLKRCEILCRLSGQQNSELPVTYREVQQQQV